MSLTSPAPGAEIPTRLSRLLLVVDSLDVGGAERHVVDLALALRRVGHEVTVACSVAGALSELLAEADVPVRTLMDQLVKRHVSLAYARGLARLVREERFDLVHAHIYASEAAAAIATLGTDIPLVVTQHTEALWQNRRTRLVNQRFCRRAARVIAVSDAVQRRLVERDNIPPEKITMIPNAVPAASEARCAVQPLPDEWREGPLVGVVARLHPDKGVANFLKAASRVAPLFPKARFIVAGDGPLREELEGLVRRLGLGNAHFLGFRADSRALTGMLDILVVPSLTEGAPLVVLEAMAAGIPVVATAVGGIPDQIRHGEEGLLVPPRDPVALGDALLKLLRNPDLAQRMGNAGLRRTAIEFSHAKMVARVEAVYHAALGIPRAPSADREEPESWAAG